MHANRRPRAARAFLALVFCLALLGDHPGHSLVTPGKRDDRERPGPALPGVLVTAVAAAASVVAGRRAGRPAGRRAAAHGARAPPPQPAPI
jgi:hypothetical protein